MELPSLSDLFWAHLGPLADKWEQYIPLYEAELRRYLECKVPVVLLEIGVMNGGSLELWRKLLPPHSRVVGMDIDERCRGLQLSDGIELHIGDATQRTFVDSALGETRFDIIIDDGSHRSIDIIATFESLFSRLKPGGSYIVEDLHTSYWPEYGGGFRTEGSSIEWAKKLVDAINADHIKNTADVPSEEVAKLKEFNEEIARIAFFDSALVVQKYLAPKYRSFARVVTGTKFPVFDPLQWIHSMPADSLGNLIVGPTVARRLETGLTRSLEEKEDQLACQKQELQRKEQELQRQAQQLHRQAQQLMSLHTSTSWKITGPFRRVGEILRSLRRSIARSRIGQPMKQRAAIDAFAKRAFVLMRTDINHKTKLRSLFAPRSKIRSVYERLRAKATTVTSPNIRRRSRHAPVAIIPYVHDHEEQEIRQRFGLDSPAGKKIDAILFQDRERMGPERSFEHCWSRCPDRDIVILHSDMQPMPNDTTNAWWDRLLEYRDSLSDAGMIACNLMYPEKDHWAAGEVQCAGGTFINGVIGHHRGHVSQDVLDRVRIVDWVTFGGVLIRRELLDACGSFDSRYRWAYVMDVDYCFEARLKGFLLYQVPVWLTHHENRTTRPILDNDPAARAAVAFNLQTFYDKWGPLAPNLPSRVDLLPVGRDTFTNE